MSGTAFISDFGGVAVGVPRMTWRSAAWNGFILAVSPPTDHFARCVATG